MSIAALVSDGIVINRIVVTEPCEFSLPGCEVIPTTAEFDIGWSYADGVFTPPPVEE